jgi:hypothetical protein
MNNNVKSEKLTFFELINKYKIEIPIIQRDYAQGREGKEELRNTFLADLKNAIISKNILELDFVYGSTIINESGKNILLPLDGQQRLTTLFLLYWYASVKEGRSAEAKSDLLNFTYEIRTSSREFCEELVKNDFDFYNLLETDFTDNNKTIPKNNQFSKSIINTTWFFLTWKRDPTINSMLTMLDSIHFHFNKIDNIWNNLGYITFHFIELKKFGLSDDLYIKMNARGKALTPFENFKAKFEQQVKENKWDENIETTNSFFHLLDTKWTDLFWNHNDENLVFDDKILKFMSRLMMCFYAYSNEIFEDKTEDEIFKNQLKLRNKTSNITDDTLKRERIENRIKELFNDSKILNSKKDFSSENAYKFLKNSFEIYYLYYNQKPSLNLWIYISNERSLFEQLIESNIFTFKQTVLFFAQTYYLKKCSDNFDQQNISEWMRVIRNVIENSTIDSPSTFIGAVNLINELSEGCNNIYEFLTNNKISSKFAEKQVEEEVKKAILLNSYPEFKESVFKMEDTNFCKGKISFFLYCVDYHLKNDVFNIVKFNKLLNLIENEFNEGNKPLSINFKRAFLTIRNNDYYKIWNKWSYSFDIKKYWLLKNVNDLKNNFTKDDIWKEYLKDLFNKLIENNYENVISNFIESKNFEKIPSWKKKIISETELINKYEFILIPDTDEYCLLSNLQRPTREDQVKRIENN